MDFIRSAIDCLLTAWFIMGNMWVFGGRPPSTCPCLCRMVVVILTLGFVSCAVPVMVCTALCCCMPPIIRALHFHDDDDDDTTTDLEFHEYLHHKLRGGAGASEAAIHALPILTFVAAQQLPSAISCSTQDSSTSCDAKVTCCCICLGRYEEGVRVRELPCTHTFHMACVDQWLRISATCPLCKYDINQFAPEELF